MNLPAVREGDLKPELLDQVEHALALAEVPEDAERIWRYVGAVEHAARLARQTSDVQLRVGRLRLRAERRWGELLGPAEHGGFREQVSGAHLTDRDRTARRVARQVAAVPGDVFEDFLKRVTDPEALRRAALLRRVRDQGLAEQRQRDEQAARDSGLTHELVHADLRDWRPAGVDAIVTDPPYITDDAVELHSALADFALEVLPEGGPLIVMTWQAILPEVLAAMARPGLVYRWTIAWIFETAERTPDRAHRVFDGWKPIIVFHKGSVPREATYIYDLIRSENLDKESHEWGQSIEGFRRLVRAASEPGQMICDPFLGGGTTAIAALAEGRHFIGGDIDEQAVATSLERVAA